MVGHEQGRVSGLDGTLLLGVDLGGIGVGRVEGATAPAIKSMSPADAAIDVPVATPGHCV